MKFLSILALAASASAAAVKARGNEWENWSTTTVYVTAIETQYATVTDFKTTTATVTAEKVVTNTITVTQPAVVSQPHDDP